MKKILVFQMNGLTIGMSAIFVLLAAGFLGLGAGALLSGVAPTDGAHFMRIGLGMVLGAIIPWIAGIRVMPEAEAHRLANTQL